MNEPAPLVSNPAGPVVVRSDTLHAPQASTRGRVARRAGSWSFGIISAGGNLIVSVAVMTGVLWVLQATLIDLFEGLEYQGWGVAVQAWLRSLDFSPLLPWAIGIAATGAVLVAFGAWLSTAMLGRGDVQHATTVTITATLCGMVVQGLLMLIGSLLAGGVVPILIPTLPNIVALLIGMLVVSTVWAALVGTLVGPLMWWWMASIVARRSDQIVR